MLITGLQMHQLAKNILPYHIHHGHHISPVADVLQHHQRHARALAGMNKFPAFFNGHTCDHFTSHIFFGVHGVEAHHRMPLPRCCNDDRINVFVVQQLFVSVRAIENNLWFWFSGLTDHLKRLVHHDLLNIAHGNNLHVVSL